MQRGRDIVAETLTLMPKPNLTTHARTRYNYQIPNRSKLNITVFCKVIVIYNMKGKVLQRAPCPTHPTKGQVSLVRQICKGYLLKIGHSSKPQPLP